MMLHTDYCVTFSGFHKFVLYVNLETKRWKEEKKTKTNKQTYWKKQKNDKWYLCETMLESEWLLYEWYWQSEISSVG